MAKRLSKEEKAELLSITQEELTISMISRLFGKTAKKENGKMVIFPPKFDTKSPFTLEAGEYTNNEAVETTVGSFLFNKIMIEGMLDGVVENGYYNEVINKSGMKKLFSIISENLMMQKIPVEPTLIKWLKQYEFYGMKASTIFSPSYSEGLLRQNASVKKEKERLLKSKEIKSAADMTDIEDALVASASKILKKDPGKTLFDSGARGSFDNDYKNMNLMLGPVAIPGEDGEFKFVKSNYIEGLQKEDMVAAGMSIVNSAYPKAVSVNPAA